MIEIKKMLNTPIFVDVAGPITRENIVDIADWCGAYIFNENADVGLLLVTSGGLLIAPEGWYVVKRAEDEFHPCRPDIYKSRYVETGGFEDAPIPLTVDEEMKDVVKRGGF